MKGAINTLCIAALILLAVAHWSGEGGGGDLFPSDKLVVAVIEETGERGKLPPAQVAVLTGTEWQAYVRSKQGDWRVLDKDAAIAKDLAWVQEAFKVPRQSLPWLIVAGGKSDFSGPLPGDVGAMLKLLQEHGG